MDRLLLFLILFGISYTALVLYEIRKTLIDLKTGFIAVADCIEEMVECLKDEE